MGNQELNNLYEDIELTNPFREIEKVVVTA